MIQELELLQRRLEREIKARQQAESILEKKALELYEANRQLRALNETLENQIEERTKALEDSEMRYRQIVETASDLIFRTDSEGIFTYVNPHTICFLGYSKQEILGKHFTEFVHSDWKEVVTDYYSIIRDEKIANSYLEFEVSTKSGESKWVGQNVQFLYDQHSIFEVAGVARDITARKRTEDHLRITQLRFTLLIANLQSGILVEDENRKIVLANDLFCQMFGIPVDAFHLIGMDCSNSAEETKNLFLEPEQFVTEIKELLENKTIKTHEELKLVDGRIFERDYIPIVGEGKYLGHMWQYRDVTPERTIEENLRRSEEKYRGIIENMELGLMEVDNKGIIVKPYRKFCEMTGYNAEELIGKNAIDQLLVPEYLPVLKQQTLDRFVGKAGVYEMELYKKDRSKMWVMISGAPIVDSHGYITGSIGIHYDITLQKKLQKDLENARQIAEEAQEAEKQFLANMSHEIRTPLNAIIGMAHLMYDTQLDAEQKEFLTVLKNSADILKALISDVLDIAKIRSGHLELHAKPFDLIGLIKTIQKTFQLKLESKPIDVITELAPEIPEMVDGDDLLLNQILLNLMGNAEKFTETGAIGIRAAVKKEYKNQIILKFEVFDTGIGIPNDKLKDIFKAFRQVDGDIKRKYGGTGLGLAIVKQLVEFKKGTISVHSKPGKGTAFTFTIPFTKTNKSHAVQLNARESLGNIDFHTLGEVLVVEDNSMNRTYISNLLHKWKVPHQMAVNGKKGLEMALEKPFKLILMDIQMPEMDGYEAAIAIRARAGFNQHTPIVALTASAMLSKKDRAFEAGMNDYLSKPFSPAELLELFHKHFPELEIQHKNQQLLEKPDPSSLLNYAFMKEIYGEDYDYARDIFTAFLEKIDSEYPLLWHYFENGDHHALSRMAHKLKPIFPMVGLTDFEPYFSSLEEKSKDEIPDIAELERILQAIDGLLDKGIIEVKSELIRLQKLSTTP